MTEPIQKTAAGRAVGEAIEAVKTFLSAAAARHALTTVAWAFGAGALIGVTVGAILL